jgi:hypothetical protein
VLPVLGYLMWRQLLVADPTQGRCATGADYRGWKARGAVGFWGTFIVARSGRPVMELEGLKAAADQVAWQRTGGGGWQVVQIHRGPNGYDSQTLPADWERLLVLVMEQTGHPVLAAVVRDSDGAQLIGYSPNAGRWGGWLMLDRIIGHLDPAASPYAYEDENGEIQVDEGEDYQRRARVARERLYEVGGPGHVAAPGAVRWAIEAGYAPAAAAVEAVLDGGEVFAEDLFFQLLDVLGLPGLASAES